MPRLPALALLALALLLAAPPARAAVDDPQCVATLVEAMRGSCTDGGMEGGTYVPDISKLRYMCTGPPCKESLALVNPACLAEGGRLADQVATQLTTTLSSGGPPASVTAQNV